MKNHNLIIALLLALPFLATAKKPQTIQFKGVILEAGSDVPLTYVNIGLLNKPIGTVSDTNGVFNLMIGNENLNDVVQVSSVGYITQRINVAELMKNDVKTIKLIKKVTELQVVVVTDKQSETEKIGRESEGKFIQVSIHNKKSVDATVGSEMGMKIKNKKAATLKDFNWYMTANNFNSIKFRVNIYALKNNMPDTLICQQEIFANVENFKTGWTKVDLTPYNIKVKGDFVITMQWVDSKMEHKEDPITMVPVALSLSKNCYARIASQDKWKRMGVKLSCFVTLLH